MHGGFFSLSWPPCSEWPTHAFRCSEYKTQNEKIFNALETQPYCPHSYPWGLRTYENHAPSVVGMSTVTIANKHKQTDVLNEWNLNIMHPPIIYRHINTCRMCARGFHVRERIDMIHTWIPQRDECVFSIACIHKRVNSNWDRTLPISSTLSGFIIPSTTKTTIKRATPYVSSWACRLGICTTL